MLLWTDSTWTACGVSAADGVLVALSGGADSVALLLELRKLQKEKRILRVEAAHLNHAIRGREADSDTEFARALCERLSVPLAIERVDVPRAAKETGVSLELAARNARYAFLERVRSDRNLDCIAIGHHRDDQAETLLLHLLRGSGTDGLSGMRVRTGRLIRPLLHTDKSAILSYLAECGQDFCTDTTNFETDATRNRIRLNVMPVLETVNPAAKKAHYQNVQALAAKFREENGSIVCRELLDLRKNENSDPTPTPRDAQFFHSRSCANFVRCAARLLDEARYN